jgi:membrane protease YdiL (CAAX protease family)
MTKFDSIGEFMIGFVVIAIFAAFGEEFVFRGLIQSELLKTISNPHVAIWITAILFSAFHMQFFGFVPRMLLGAMFGYLYYWSGNLSLAMLAHFVNNGLQVIVIYLYQKGKLSFDPEATDYFPLSAVLASAVVTGALLYYFRKIYRDSQSAIES